MYLGAHRNDVQDDTRNTLRTTKGCYLYEYG